MLFPVLQALRSAIANHGQLQFLDLSGCSITDTGAQHLAVLLKAQANRRSELAWERGLRDYSTRLVGCTARHHGGAGVAYQGDAEFQSRERTGLAHLELAENQVQAAQYNAQDASLQ